MALKTMAEQPRPEEKRAGAAPASRRVRPSFLTVAAVAVVLSAAAWLWSRWVTAPPPAGRGQVVLAVLPFENLSGEPEPDFWADGLTDEVIAQLGSSAPGQLAVIAPATAARYRRSRKGVADIGRELAADYLLRGSLRLSGSRMRLAAELQSVAEQSPVWSASFERETREVHQLEGDLSRAVAGRIRLDYGSGSWPAEPRRSRSLGNVAPEAYSLYLKGRAAAKQKSHEGLTRALALFGQALAVDPQLAGAHLGLAESHLLLALGELVPPRDVLAQARKEAQAALRLDDTSAEGHGVYAMVRLYGEWDWAGAEQEFRRALALNPSDALTRYRFGYYDQRGRGHRTEALAEVRRALATDPLSASANLGLADLLLDDGQAADALEQCRKALAISASDAAAYLVQAAIYEDLGAFDEAEAALETAARLAPRSPAALLEVARLQALTGRRQEARRTLARSLASEPRYVPPVRLARLQVALGENGRALETLERAFAEKAVGLLLPRQDARFEPLRRNQRFRAVLKGAAPPT